MNVFVDDQIRRIISVTFIRKAKRGVRWKESMSSNKVYVYKLRLQEGRLSETLQRMQTSSKIDQAYIVLEQGVALKACGQKIFYAATTTFAESVMNAIADVYMMA